MSIFNNQTSFLNVAQQPGGQTESPIDDHTQVDCVEESADLLSRATSLVQQSFQSGVDQFKDYMDAHVQVIEQILPSFDRAYRGFINRKEAFIQKLDLISSILV